MDHLPCKIFDEQRIISVIETRQMCLQIIHWTGSVFTYLRSQLCYRCEQHGHNLEKKTNRSH